VLQVLEGTGHAAMGSLMRLTNARVASELGVECVLVAGGRTRLSNVIDDIALNRQMCAQHRLPIRGVIINGVPPDKVDDALEYIPRALKFWGLPLLGVVPHIPTLSRPCMAGEQEACLLIHASFVLQHTDSRMLHMLHTHSHMLHTQSHMLTCCTLTRI
jgi:dethiobiotin synthetase